MASLRIAGVEQSVGRSKSSIRRPRYASGRSQVKFGSPGPAGDVAKIFG